jgi:predicted acylesterase/phospholipase RssA
MANTQTALVLQGGAALGAYEYGAIKYLYESGIKPQIITGVSIGAFNAGVLGGSDNPVAALDQLWRHFLSIGGLKGLALKFIPSSKLQQIVQLGGVPNVYTLNPSALLFPLTSATSIYDLSKLRETLEKVIDFDLLNSAKSPHVAVNATDVQSGELTHFDNRTERLTIDHLMASASIAPLAPATEIAGDDGEINHYWDGGFYNNTPLSKALNLLEETPDFGQETVERELIVIELFPKVNKHIPENLEQVGNRIVELLGASKLSSDLRLMKKMDQYIDLVQAIDEMIESKDGISAEAGRTIRRFPGWKSLNAHKKIDKTWTITPSYPLTPLSLLDFSERAIELRIEAGYKDAEMAMKDRTPRQVDD